MRRRRARAPQRRAGRRRRAGTWCETYLSSLRERLAADGSATGIDQSREVVYTTRSGAASRRHAVGNCDAVAPERAPERVVGFKPRNVVTTALILVGLALALWVVYVSRQVLAWVFVSVFLALALHPAVEWLHRHGFRRRSSAAAVIYVGTLVALVGLGFLLIPPLVNQARGLADEVPHYVNDLTKGRGPLGFLETKYHVVDKVRHAIDTGSLNIAGGAGTALSITKGIVTAVVAVVTIAFMTFFMLLEGPAWLDR